MAHHTIETEIEALRKGSVVSQTAKQRYAERAAARQRKVPGVSKKALKRSSQDWLALELAKRTLDERDHLVVEAFEHILDLNGIKHSHWNRTTPGWQGRLRMTGRLALQRVVAEAGKLEVDEGISIEAPKNWIAKHQS